ncbi:MAG: hypothetical protein RBS78_09215, partial [Coriobacteriia bacterium]|nr:hypothetical protein [Coriobacteriia bacterium]
LTRRAHLAGVAWLIAVATVGGIDLRVHAHPAALCCATHALEPALTRRAHLAGVAGFTAQPAVIRIHA